MLTGRLLCLFFILLFAVNAQAGSLPVIVKVSPIANISLIASTLGGTVLDSLPGANTYLLKLPSLPLLTTALQLLGVQWIEQNKLMAQPRFAPVAMLSTPGATAADWYKYEPSMMLIR